MRILSRLRSFRLLAAILALAMIAAACGDDASETVGGDTEAAAGAGELGPETVLNIGAIPDQEPERLQRTYDLLSDYLETSIPGLTVEYTPVTEYQGAVTAFQVGDLDTVWFGGLTGVQARIEVDGAQAIAQRDIDEQFTSVFIASADSGIEPFTDVDGLVELKGRSLTFGSESSTSGRLMPQSFLSQAGVSLDDLEGAPGFSGSHDATIEVVGAGAFEVGALNSQVWDARVADGTVDTDQVIEIFRTPTYFDYHWVAQPDLDDRFGAGFTDQLVGALTALDPADAEHAEILELFGAGGFIVTDNDNYGDIESVGREAGLIR